MEFKIQGIRIKIHWAFLAMLGVYVVLGLGVQAVFIFSLVIGHEAAHLLTAKAYGFKVEGMELFPFGGAAYSNDIFEGRKWEESVIALAGPLFNLMLMFGVQFLRWNSWWGGAMAADFLRFNFWLAAFNLLPVLPLDGGRVVRALLTGTFGFVKVTKLLAWAGKWLGLILGILGIVSTVSVGFSAEAQGNLYFVLLGAFFWLAGNKELGAARITFLRQLTHKKEELMRKGLMPSRWLTVYENTPVVRVVETLTPDSYALIALAQDDPKQKKILTESEVLEGMFREGIRFPVGKL